MPDLAERFFDALQQTRVVAIARTRQADGLIEAFGALCDGGVVLVEVTLTIPGALGVIREASTRFGSAVQVGCGTVLDARSAEDAIEAGASFVVSPSFHEDVVATCAARGVVAVPGCLTPTEVATAMRAGSQVIKLFPGRVATPDYLRDLLGPLPGARFLPTGNVDLDTAPRYIESGAVAVGVGKALLDPVAIGEGSYATITAAARSFREAVDAVGRSSR
jgi:2-dehydro-3-deoxyphosphogluconate aldolase/(4S)-4-hydroxy-2-oxoglutarate aldolase